ncbi:winged helix-turn-helix domain-containing protein [Paraburkholderia sp. J94]|uniref:winged helix-turn-helix domain-containing protein n=1 Tax=Paraburkholderia sp. J94 TaxID=2805441 RepID=UPI002AAF4470|nr:winged helix-turn-helix domain-containing protein [Paraburkholderia sp. J94]
MYTFDRVSVCLESREVYLGGQRHSLSTRAFDILELLINARGRLVTKDEIMRVVWPRTFVVDNNIHVHVCELRKLFGGKQGWIRTDSGRGYRLTPPEPREREHQPRAASPALAAPRALVGRERELAELLALVDSEALLTLVGAPGIGKSSLARELMRERASTGDRRTVFVELADAAPGTSVVSALATALGLPLPHDRSAIVAAVAQRPALIVFDGCDAFIDEVASLCRTLSTFGSRVHLVATSREPLHLSAERTWRVPPLGTPAAAGSDAEVAAAPAVRLFMQRLGETMGDGPLQTGEHGQNLLNVVASLCRRVGGNPLALEVAAARAATLGVLGVLELSDEQWLVLGNAMHEAPARHRSLAAAYAWSCTRLAPHERSALSRLASLPDSFTIETACAIAEHCALDNEAMLDALASLVSKSLVEVETSPHRDGRRYRLPHALRAFMHSLIAAAVSQPGEAQQAENAAIVVDTAPRPHDETAIDSVRTPVSASPSFPDRTAIAYAEVAVPTASLRMGKSPAQSASPSRRDRPGAREPANHLRLPTCDGRAKIAASCRVPSVFCLGQGKRRTQRERS